MASTTSCQERRPSSCRSTSRALSSAMLAWLTSPSSSQSDGQPKRPCSPRMATAPVTRPRATNGASSQEPAPSACGGRSPSATSGSRPSGRMSAPRRSMSCEQRAPVGPARGPGVHEVVRVGVAVEEREGDLGGRELSRMCRSSRSMTEARRRVPASSWPNAVTRRSRARSSVGRSARLAEGGVTMIRANTRGRLTAADLQLVILLLSRGSAHRRASLERRLATEGPDPLLDSPELLERLLTVRTMLVPSEALFFYVVVRHALRSAGHRRPRAGRLPVGPAARLRPARPRLAHRLARRPAAPIPGGHPGGPRGERRRAPVPGHAAPGQLRALARRSLSRLYRGPPPPQSGSRRHLLRHARPPRVRHGLGPRAGGRVRARSRCSGRPPSGFPRSAGRSTA